MNALTISPVQWSDFSNIDDVPPINKSDTECLAEIRDVLKKYDRLNRFGVALLHTHFQVADDEILLESANNVDRKLVIEPTKEKNTGKNNVGTIWALREGDNIEAMSWCRQYCQRAIFGHDSAHNRED